jgi:hypothetical protein
VVSSFLAMMVISRWPIADWRLYRKHQDSSYVMIQLRNVPSLSGHLKCPCDCHIGLASGHVEHCVG